MFDNEIVVLSFNSSLAKKGQNDGKKEEQSAQNLSSPLLHEDTDDPVSEQSKHSQIIKQE